MIGAAAGLAVALLLVFIYVRTRKTIRQADDVKKLTNAAFLGNLPEAKIKKRSNVKEQTITICNPKCRIPSKKQCSSSGQEQRTGLEKPTVLFCL